ncbi:DUF3102 domain-containing protein [Desulfobacter postgatei]|uniref:DUF3102 domain-containing protein n=1 Tax=Desulfobacter postgatei TaxID=2293 RepID=UPI002FDAEE9C
MTSDITQYETPAPVEITEDIQTSLNRLGRELETHAESGIRIGKELIHLKEITPHGKFGELVEWAYGLSKQTRSKYMQVAEKFGEKSLQYDFSHTVLIELSKPSVPESARESAAMEESLTVKQAKELAEAHKRIQELEAGRQPNKDNLIPGLMKKYKGASITPGMADRLSVLPIETQEIFLSLFDTQTMAVKEAKTAMEDKLKTLEDLHKISKERDEIKQQLEDIAETDTATVLLEKEKALKQAREEYERRLINAKKTIGKEASEFHEQRFKDMIKAAEEAKEKAERKAKEEQERASAAWKRDGELEREIKKLKEQLEVDNPANVDNARMKHVEDAGRGFLVAIEWIGRDMDRIGGGMENSIAIAEAAIKQASLELAKLQGMQDAIINV